ncbi:MAG: hypothetical protein M3N13_10875, partial [Candidatus Eremiobacteraeota bacterium]|nr:hypothetical protein [Candidatus Eremiobacteraeota bacterium]
MSPAGVRLTTMEVTFPRFVLAEFNTHRTFCLDGGTRLYFDASKKRENKGGGRIAMTLREFHDAWHERVAAPKNRIARMQHLIAGSRDYAGVDLVAFRGSVPPTR